MLSTLYNLKKSRWRQDENLLCRYIKIDLESTEGLLSFEGL